ncbi:MAG: hypothetical protein V2A74_04410 [bacterium]
MKRNRSWLAATVFLATLTGLAGAASDLGVGSNQDLTATANAPVISQLPDVTIGELEDITATVAAAFNLGVGLQEDLTATPGNPFFGYPNAFNFDHFVTDADTPASDIRWSFMEQDTNNFIAINGQTQLTGGDDPINPPGGGLTGVGGDLTPTASFQDIQANPLGSSPSDPQFTGNLTTNRILTVFASDGTEATSGTLIVRSVQGVYDHLTGAHQEYDFTGATGGFQFTTFSVFGSVPATSSQTGGLRVSSPNDGLSRFGYWAGPPEGVTWIPNSLYRARWVLTTDQTDPLLVPSARLRWNTEAGTGGSMLQVTSYRTDGLGPTAAGKVYDSYFDAPDLSSVQGNSSTDGLIVEFDFIDFDADEFGELAVTGLEIERIDKSLLPAATPLKTFATTDDFASFAFVSANEFTPAVGLRGLDSLRLSSGLVEDNVFGAWQSIPGNPELAVESGKLYRATFNVSSENIINKGPSLRTRMSLSEFQINAMLHVNTNLGIYNWNSVADGGTNLVTYLKVPAGTMSTPQELVFALDLIDFTTDEGGDIDLNSVTVEDVPEFLP